jgi:VanZ family protein
LAAGVGFALLPGRVAERVWVMGWREHVAGFAALTLAGMAAAGLGPGWRVAAGTLGLGVAVELAQRLVPGRGFQFEDIAADAAGVAAGWAAAWALGVVRNLGDQPG